MKKLIKTLSLLIIIGGCSIESFAQGMHFSQYYNAPLLLNPANAGLMPDNDYRVGVNYRKQWASIPVPYQTTAAFADFQAMRTKNETNWLGTGLSFWNDKVGDGGLSLTRMEATLAYHIQLGDYSMVSVGAAGAYAQRSVDFNKFTFDNQWDGFVFNSGLPTGESGYLQKTNFIDVAAGINFAVFPNENTYIKIGLGMAHLTEPKESFYGITNTLGMRPTVNIDGLFKVNETIIVNPSVYYTTQKGAYELVYGILFDIHIIQDRDNSTQLSLGAFHRMGDAVIASLGITYKQFKIMGSYDITMSTLSTANQGKGAVEFGLTYRGLYNSFSQNRKSYTCPRF